jgi:hypothetical protein
MFKVIHAWGEEGSDGVFRDRQVAELRTRDAALTAAKGHARANPGEGVEISVRGREVAWVEYDPETAVMRVEEEA